MAVFHERMRDWIENSPRLVCPLCPEDRRWEFLTSGLDTKGDVNDAYRRHLERHDTQLSDQVDAFLKEQP